MTIVARPTADHAPVSDLFRAMNVPRWRGYDLWLTGSLPIPVERIGERLFVRRADLSALTAG
jgi:hypothetical protein